jgi:integrating conjugative element protein (TIGR03759 family)
MSRALLLSVLLSLLLIPLPGLGETETAVELRATQLTESEPIRRAEAWGLHLDEWQRYETLMQGQRGLWSPDLDPIMVLGIHARSPEERRRYAELAVEQEHSRVAGELAFQRAYDEAWQRLYPDELLIDTAALLRAVSPQASANPAGVSIENRILLFTRTTGCPACDAILEEVIERSSTLRVGLDIYLQDTRPGDEPAVRAWAGKQGIALERVRAREITLNHDQGTAARLGIWQAPPALAVQTAGGIRAIAVSDLR